MRKLGIRTQAVADHRSLHGPERCAVVLYTSGTAGRPSGVMLSDRNVDAVARQMHVLGPILPGQRVLSVVPYSYGLGFGVCLHTVIAGGAETVMLPHFTSRSIARAIRRRRPDYLVGVPSFYASLVSERLFTRARLAFLMGAFVGGERISTHLLDAFEMAVRRRGGAVGIREGYGLTETVAACVATPETVRRTSSVGIPVPDTKLRIVSADPSVPGLDALAYDEVGEICVSGPGVMLGYVNAEGRARITDQDGVRWLRTGDLGRMDADGFVYFVDRTGSAMSLDQGPLYPGIVEGTLNAHPEVKEACVTVELTVSGPLLTAHVVPIDDDLEPDWVERTLRQWCTQNLEDRYRPSVFVFREALPHTRLGVVDYRRVAGRPVPSAG
jgi:long-chain acyl-CoA synthetase